MREGGEVIVSFTYKGPAKVALGGKSSQGIEKGAHR